MKFGEHPPFTRKPSKIAALWHLLLQALAC